MTATRRCLISLQVEGILRQAFKLAETQYRKSIQAQQSNSVSSDQEIAHSKSVCRVYTAVSHYIFTSGPLGPPFEMWLDWQVCIVIKLSHTLATKNEVQCNSISWCRKT